MNDIFFEDAFTGTDRIDDGSVHTIVTSPPYFFLRDYKLEPTKWPSVRFCPMHGLPEIEVPQDVSCLGLEGSINLYVGHFVAMARQWMRILRNDGTLFLNLGDSYAGDGGEYTNNGLHDSVHPNSRPASPRARDGSNSKLVMNNNAENGYGGARAFRRTNPGLRRKNLMGIPWRVAFALQADGWTLRQEIIWHKPNAMPSSVKDRCTTAHEHLFLFSKSRHYYFDYEAISEPISPNTHARMAQDIANQNGSARGYGGAKHNGNMKAVGRKVPAGWDTETGSHGNFHRDGRNQKAIGAHAGSRQNESFSAAISRQIFPLRNKRSVWSIPTESFSEAHYSTFPTKLVEPCILAGCPIGGTVFDPFMGSGTTALVARRNLRNYIGFEADIKNKPIIEKRLATLGLFQ